MDKTICETFLPERVAIAIAGLGNDRETGGKTMHVAEDGRSVSLNVKFWLENDGSIRLTSEADPSLRVIIKNDPDRPLGHPALFKRLAKVLRIMGVPSPAA